MDNYIIYAFIIAFLTGFSPIIHRYILPRISGAFIMLVSAITYGLAVLFYIYFWKWSDVVKDMKDSKPYIPLLAATTLFGMFFANILYLYAIKHTSNINTVIVITALYPVVTLVLASIFLKERLSIWGLLGFFMILVGISVLLYTSQEPS